MGFEDGAKNLRALIQVRTEGGELCCANVRVGVSARTVSGGVKESFFLIFSFLSFWFCFVFVFFNAFSFHCVLF